MIQGPKEFGAEFSEDYTYKKGTSITASEMLKLYQFVSYPKTSFLNHFLHSMNVFLINTHLPTLLFSLT